MNLRNIIWYVISFVFALVLFACQKPSNNTKTTQQTTVHESADGSQKNEAKNKSEKIAKMETYRLESVKQILTNDQYNQYVALLGKK